MTGVLIGELMSTPAVTVGPGTLIREAIGLMGQHRLTAMPVIGPGSELIGIISEADVIGDLVFPDQRAHAARVAPSPGPGVHRVDEVMTRHVITVPVNADLATAAELMMTSAVKSLPVVKGYRVVGMISRSDIVHALARRDALIEREVDDLLRVSGTDWTVHVTAGIATIDGPRDDAERELVEVLAGSVPGIIGIQFSAPRLPGTRRT